MQETHTFTIVPAVDLNFRLGNDKFAGNKRYGWFGTVAVGYNPATTMVEFGVGPSLAVKSMVFSFLADVGRDTAAQCFFLPAAARGCNHPGNKRGVVRQAVFRFLSPPPVQQWRRPLRPFEPFMRKSDRVWLKFRC